MTSEAQGSFPGRNHTFRLPLPGWPRAYYRAGLDHEDARLLIDGRAVLKAETRDELRRGVTGQLGDGTPIAMQLSGDEVLVAAGEKPAMRDDQLRAKPTRSAWIHAFIALAGSGAGFIASYFYLAEAEATGSQWAHKMGIHMAVWHLLLTLTLFPASVWGQRLGIRIVQLVSLIFFGIHVAIAAANLDMKSPPIAFFNALSGIMFLASVVYGQRAHRDMDPVAALEAGRLLT